MALAWAFNKRILDVAPELQPELQGGMPHDARHQDDTPSYNADPCQNPTSTRSLPTKFGGGDAEDDDAHSDARKDGDSHVRRGEERMSRLAEGTPAAAHALTHGTRGGLAHEALPTRRLTPSQVAVFISGNCLHLR